MKLLISVLASLFVISAMGQDREFDDLLVSETIGQHVQEDLNFNGFIYAFYKNHVSRQILNDCIYDHSCSKFSHDVFENFGLIKGLFLTADRLTRCNRASLAELPPSRINMNGSAIDHWNFYANKD